MLILNSAAMLRFLEPGFGFGYGFGYGYGYGSGSGDGDGYGYNQYLKGRKLICNNT